jgi:hypothetical protein
VGPRRDSSASEASLPARPAAKADKVASKARAPQKMRLRVLDMEARDDDDDDEDGGDDGASLASFIAGTDEDEASDDASDLNSMLAHSDQEAAPEGLGLYRQAMLTPTSQMPRFMRFRGRVQDEDEDEEDDAVVSVEGDHASTTTTTTTTTTALSSRGQQATVDTDFDDLVTQREPPATAAARSVTSAAPDVPTTPATQSSTRPAWNSSSSTSSSSRLVGAQASALARQTPIRRTTHTPGCVLMSSAESSTSLVPSVLRNLHRLRLVPVEAVFVHATYVIGANALAVLRVKAAVLARSGANSPHAAVFEMLRRYARVFVIVEMEPPGAPTTVASDALQFAILRLCALGDNTSEYGTRVRVLTSTSEKMCAALIAQLAGSPHLSGAPFQMTIDWFTANRPALSALVRLPTLSITSAAQLLREFGSLAAVLDAAPDRLRLAAPALPAHSLLLTSTMLQQRNLGRKK